MSEINPGDLIDKDWVDYPQPHINLLDPWMSVQSERAWASPVFVVAVVASQRSFDHRYLHWIISPNTMGWSWGSNWDNPRCVERST